MQQDRPLLGILLMLGFCVVAPMGDAMAKLLSDRVSIGELLFLRFAVQALVLLPVMVLTRRVWRMRRRVFGLTLLRTAMHMLGVALMFFSLRYLPLADAIAIAFVLPFLMLLLGHYLLGEEVGIRRMAACAVGFVGTLMVVQPAFREVGWPALLPLGVAVNFAFFMLVTRQIAREVDAISLQAVSGLVAMAVVAPVLWLLPGSAVPGFGWQPPEPGLWGMILGIGLFGTLAHLLMTWSLRFAPGATLAPLQYLELPIATALGFFIFGDLPNGLATLGIFIIMAAGLYILMRERATARPSVPAPVPVPETPPPAE
ncbi:DMT family transporter [Salipiger marinus]|jgi:drug/metabolite transporter (DMT)-like permease|uniref:DMT family transporter n=1 Tax=Salipiger marinus TaxID=555512 RepID=UPI000E850A43|nr:DMT family transporter [Salipiger manganoxidans]MCD1617610.1 DMT family transporter [Salipiger manganoxidans]MEB3419582.1 DMT family transporter [Salipiger manganoxidans]HBM61224.1 EamA/RhaT family transporter [Citreicella sp.]HBS98712.1 EamA/RhaT family transporter [Citreicella sp.]|tara:strand:- start:244 stop:1185 length:942 start_codon:yes stop_codon:yes gene_type:complete